uniref:JmjC domain-containing protein n=2 Tax=Lepeophtheirus salmonis TaxID=72036 RepID=A0A0K2U1I1_LEPSM
MGSMEEPLILSTRELQILSELDSSQFGILKLKDDTDHPRSRCLALKAIKYLERLLMRRKKRIKDLEEAELPLNPRIYCKLGHLHLLLEDYPKALSAYQKYLSLDTRNWEDPNFLYGLGLVYFHYNAYPWAIRALTSLLYVNPGFPRASDVHLRLALIYKTHGNFSSSLKHFRLAGPLNHFTRFHLAHLLELQGKYTLAKEKYESLLQESSLSQSLKADVYRHLGWMYHGVESLGEKSVRIANAISALQKSIEADPKSGQSLYLLGRCYASIGKVHEAFIAYRNSVDKSESNADTWCSIGVLYQQQNQPMDALQAYICAVQLDKFHAPAWTNLGILYESSMQPQDALACFTNSVTSVAQGNNKASLSTSHANLHQRIKYLKTQLSNAPPQPSTPSSTGTTTNNSSATSSTKPKQLPTVEEAWNLPISNEMTSRQPNQSNVRKQEPPAGPVIKRFRTETGVTSIHENTRPSFYLTNQQIQTLQFLQNQPSLLPQQQQLLQQLQHQLRQMQQHQQQMRQQHQLSHLRQQQQFNASTNSLKPELPVSSGGGGGGVGVNHDLLADLQNKDLGSVSDKELEALISQQDIGSFAENLLKQIQADGGNDDHHMDIEIKKEAKDEGDKKDSTEEKSSKDTVRTCSLEDIPVELSVVYKKYKKLELNIQMSADDIAKACKSVGPGTNKISSSLMPLNHSSPPRPPERPKVKLTKEQLLPPTPSVYLENKKDAFSPQLQEFCLQHPITVVRGIAAALKMDLGLFSTKTLVQLHPEHPIDIWTQKRQSADDNLDSSNSKQVWKCSSSTTKSSISKYAHYQMSTFSESLKEDRSGNRLSGGDDSPNAKRSANIRKNTPGSSNSGSTGGNSVLKFGFNVDLSEHQKWRSQLTELMKLPTWVRVVSAGNMLSHLGHKIFGMNTVKLLMNVPYARIPAHQEDNNFCTINLNIGPGDCEWFGVPEDYWGVLYSLCEKHNVDYLSGSWWPNMRDLMEEEIPVYRFLQRPGDLVWVNSGCVYWVQASGWCNNIAWNVGPLTYKQFTSSIERYEWNKLQFHKSTVAMLHLTWNIARNVRFTDKKLFEVIKYTLMQSLRQIHLTLDYIKKIKGIEAKFQARQKNDPAHYCCQCDIEVFSIMFVREMDGKVLIFCLNCAKRQGNGELKTFICLEEYKLTELYDVYNNFTLHTPQPIVPSPSALPPGPPPSMASAAAAAAALSHQQATAEMAAAMQAAMNPLMSAGSMAAALQAAAAAGGMGQYSILPPS